LTRSIPDIVFALVGDVYLSSRALRQLRWLAAEGISVEALTFGGAGREEIAAGVRLHLIERPPGRGPQFFWRVHRAFRAAALARPARIYHASDLFTLPGLAAAARLHGGRLVFDSRELYPHVDATAGKPWSRLVWSAVEHRYIRRCETVFTVNDSIARLLRDTYDIPEPVVVRNLSVPPPPDGRKDLRERLGLPEDRPIVLYQGLFNRGRGLEVLIEAMVRIPEADLVLIGDGPLRSEISSRAAGMLGERAHLLPFIPPDELRALTASADVGVHVPEPITESVRLALPNKLFEYLAADVPVIVTDLPEMAAVVRAHDVGLIVPPGDVDQLAEALRRALNDAAARERWRRNIPAVFRALDPARERQRFVEVYRKLLF
jgi:glycosyltransferase involved in cell wall biosynthesis